jgi:acyl-coenzyme A synthetase/AMP-(fatty) acid ligase
VTESQVQVQPDSSGKKVRTIEVTTYINGVPTVVEMQVVAIADELGNPISLAPAEETQDALLFEARLQTEILIAVAEGITHRKLERADYIQMLNEQPDFEQESDS